MGAFVESWADFGKSRSNFGDTLFFSEIFLTKNSDPKIRSRLAKIHKCEMKEISQKVLTVVKIKDKIE